MSQRWGGRPGKDDRRFFEAVVWWRRTGVPWRDLPEDFGPWKTVFNRFDRWSKRGRWEALFAALQAEIDREWQSIDSTINRAHQHAAGGKGGPLYTASAVHAEDRRPRSTSSSMRSAFRSPSK
jgi:transposase